MSHVKSKVTHDHHFIHYNQLELSNGLLHEPKLQLESVNVGWEGSKNDVLNEIQSKFKKVKSTDF